jgi:hypothetical protein
MAVVLIYLKSGLTFRRSLVYLKSASRVTLHKGFELFNPLVVFSGATGTEGVLRTIISHLDLGYAFEAFCLDAHMLVKKRDSLHYCGFLNKRTLFRLFFVSFSRINRLNQGWRGVTHMV